MAAKNRRAAGDSRISTRLFRTNLDQAARLQFSRELAGLSAGCGHARRRISTSARARHETIQRLAAL
ncbi:MAG: hypothetical protein DMC62_08110, partial [Verrucomicrobia bacterium]